MSIAARFRQEQKTDAEHSTKNSLVTARNRRAAQRKFVADTVYDANGIEHLVSTPLRSAIDPPISRRRLSARYPPSKNPCVRESPLRWSLYKALGETGNPEFETMLGVLRALGVELTARPLKKSQYANEPARQRNGIEAMHSCGLATVD